MELYYKIFEVVFPVFFIIWIGFFVGKKDKKFDTNFITNFAGKIGTPALIFYSITSTGVTFNLFIEHFVYALFAITIFALVGLIFLFFLKKDLITELPPFILPNTGNMGLPICLFAYGSQGLGVAAAIASVVVLFHFTIGVLLASRKLNLKILIKNAPVYAILISMVFLYFDIRVPRFIENTTFLISYATIFLVLMSLGIALSRLKVFSFTSAFISSIARVILGPLIGLFIINVFNLSGYEAGVVFIQCSMPSAILTYLVGSMYSSKRVVDSIASMIVVSTVISFFTIPIIVFIALNLFS